jgi:hypothetical protein
MRADRDGSRLGVEVRRGIHFDIRVGLSPLSMPTHDGSDLGEPSGPRLCSP